MHLLFSNVIRPKIENLHIFCSKVCYSTPDHFVAEEFGTDNHIVCNISTLVEVVVEHVLEEECISKQSTL